MNNDDREQRIQSVAHAILRYISTRPNAAETAEGIARWWLTRQRFEDAKEIVESALDYLVANNSLVKRNINGKTLYMKAD